MDIEEQPPLAVGARIKLARTRAGMSRAVLAHLVGRSADWVKAVETERIYPPRLPMLGLLASVLRVRIHDLLADTTPSAESLIARKHPALEAVRDSLNGVGSHSEDRPVMAEEVQLQIAAAWRSRHASSDHRTVLGKLLPNLIQDTDVLAARRDSLAHVLRAEVLGLAQMFLAYQSADLVWRVIDRGLVNAAESGRQEVFASAAWFAAQAHKDAGEWDTALGEIDSALRRVNAGMEKEASNELAAWTGALNAEAAIVSAKQVAETSARNWFVRNTPGID